MDNSFEAVSRHLQLQTSPQEYIRIARELQFRKLIPSQRDYPRPEDDVLVKEYGGMLPSYVVACCPFCNRILQEPIDTYSLLFWQPEPLRDWSISHYSGMSTQCEHRVGSQTFVNLRGQLPVELLSTFGRHTFACQNGDVPFLLEDWLPDEIPSAAVIHSLPICSLTENQFVATYQVYAITYFSVNPRMVKQRRLDNYPYPSLDYGPQLDWPDSLKKHPERAHLYQWAKKEKLYWLDLENDDLPLQTGDAFLPYGNITGFASSYVFYDPPLKVPKWMFWKHRQMRANGHIQLTIDQPWHPVMKKP